MNLKKLPSTLIAVMTAIVFISTSAYADYPDAVNHTDLWNNCSGARYHFYSNGDIYYVYSNACVKGQIYDGDERTLCENEGSQMPVTSFSHGYMAGWYYSDGSSVNPCDPDYLDNYVLTVTDGTVDGKKCATVTKGETVTLTATAAPADKMFDKWVVTSGSTSISTIMSNAAITSSTASVTMPEENLTLKATYKGLPLTYTSNPRNGSRVSSLNEIVIECNQRIYYLLYNSVSQRTLSVKDGSGVVICDALLDYVDGSERIDRLKLTLDTPISTPGNYSVVIPKEFLQNFYTEVCIEDDLMLSFTVSADAGGDNSDESGEDFHNYLDDFEKSLDEAISRGGKQTLYLNEGQAFSYSIMKKLSENPDITIVFTYTYQNVKYQITLSGKDVKAYENIPWYGPIYLYTYYGTAHSIIG